MSNDALQKINGKLGETLQKLFEDNKELSQVREIRDAIEWYKEADEVKEESGKVESMVVNKIIEKILEIVPLEFLNITFNKIILEGKERANKDIEFDLAVDLPSIKPNVYFTIVVNGVKPRNQLKISFEINVTLRLEGVRVHSNDFHSVSVKVTNAHFISYLLSTMMIGQKKKKIGEMDFRLEDLIFTQQKAP